MNQHIVTKLGLIFSWGFSLLTINVSSLPIAFSCIASVLVIVKTLMEIRKLKRKK
jgi:hypothetical protein